MREFSLGAIKNDISSERCARIRSLLAIAREILKENRLVDTHHDLYESVCPR